MPFNLKELGLADEECKTFESKPIRALIDNRTINHAQALALTPDQRRNLESASIRTLLGAQKIALEAAMGLTINQWITFESESVCALIVDGTITLDKVLQLTIDQRTAIEDQDVMSREGSRDFFDDSIGGAGAYGAAEAVAPHINKSRSSHNASVHRPVSESATQLKNDSPDCPTPHIMPSYCELIVKSQPKLNLEIHGQAGRLYYRALLVSELISKGYSPMQELMAIKDELLLNEKTIEKPLKIKLVRIFFHILKKLNQKKDVDSQLLVQIQLILSNEFLSLVNDLNKSGSFDPQRYVNITTHSFEVTTEPKSWDIPSQLNSDHISETLLINKARSRSTKTNDEQYLKSIIELIKKTDLNRSEKENITYEFIDYILNGCCNNYTGSLIDEYSHIEELYHCIECIVIDIIKNFGVECLLTSCAKLGNNLRNIRKYDANLLVYDFILSTALDMHGPEIILKILNKKGSALENKHKEEIDRDWEIDPPRRLDSNYPYYMYSELRKNVELTCQQAHEIASLVPGNVNIEDAETVLGYLLSGNKHINSFQLFYQQFKKINGSADSQHCINWIDFESRHAGRILMLHEIMDGDAFSYLKGKIASSCLQINRFLENIDILPLELIHKLKRFYKENKQKFNKRDNKEQLCHIISCANCIFSTVHKSNRPEMTQNISEIFDKHINTVGEHKKTTKQLKSKRPDRTKLDFATLEQELTHILIGYVAGSDESDNKNDLDAGEGKHQIVKPEVNFKMLASRIPPHLFTRLVRAKITMSDNEYEAIYTEMIKRDMLPATGSVTDLVHDTSQSFEIGRELATHNARIRSSLDAKDIGISAVNYNKTLDVNIYLGDVTATSLASYYYVLISYLEHATEAAQIVKVNDKKNTTLSQEKRFQSLSVTLDSIQKIIKTKGIDTLGTAHGKQLLGKAINNLNAIVKNLDKTDKTGEANRRKLEEFKDHVDQQMELISNDSPKSPKRLNKNKHKVLKISIQQWNKNDPQTFFLGDRVGCCLASDASQFPAMVQRRMDDAMQFFVATDQSTGNQIALLWMYLAEDKAGNIYLVMNFPEVAASYANNEVTRKALLNALLLFAHQYMRDNPGIKGFFMDNPLYGWNVRDLDAFPMQKIPEGLDKLGGPFAPGYSFDELQQESKECLHEFITAHYYLASLNATSLSKFSPGHLDQSIVEKIHTKEQIAQNIMTDEAEAILKKYILSNSYTRHEVERLMFAISKYGLVDAIWDDISIRVRAKLSCVVGDFFPAEQSFDDFLIEQRRQCLLNKIIPQQLQSSIHQETPLLQQLVTQHSIFNCEQGPVEQFPEDVKRISI